jgi:hypothetical protein
MKNIKSQTTINVDQIPFVKQVTMVTSIGDFEEDILWMSARKWLYSNKLSELDPDYPQKVTERYWRWGGLSENQQKKLILDVEREVASGWSNKERSYRLLKDYNSASFQSSVYVPYPKCDDFEFTMIRLAILYACGRQTIASATLPSEIIKNRYKYLTAEQKKIIVKDMTEYLDMLEDNNMERVFGDKKIDHKGWIKFMTALDNNCHYVVKVGDPQSEDIQEIVCFKCKIFQGHWNEKNGINEFVEEEVVYPLDSYLSQPSHEIYIPNSYIIN